VTKAPKNRKTL